MEWARSIEKNQEILIFRMAENEFLRRIGVRLKLLNSFNGKLEPSILETLKCVVFEIMYPTWV